MLKRWPSIFLFLAALLSSALLVEAQVAPPPGSVKLSVLDVVNMPAGDPSVDIRSFIETVKAERAKGPTELNVELMHGPSLSILPEPREPAEVNVKPNPLLLIVAVDEKGNLELNFEKQGSLSNLAPITKRLVKVFKDRETNGVLREGKNEIEKAVSLRLAPVLTVSDLQKIASVVEQAGSDRIIFLVDPPDTEVLFELPLMPAVPAPKRKNRVGH